VAVRCAGQIGPQHSRDVVSSVRGGQANPKHRAGNGPKHRKPRRTSVVKPQHTAHHGPMAAAMGLIGALIGAFIAFAGQLAVYRTTRHDQWTGKLHERCAQVYALERECDLAVWEILHGRSTDRLDQWDYPARRRAEAEILLLTHHPDLAMALANLTATGMKLSVEAQDYLAGTSDEVRLRQRRHEHAAMVASFCESARDALGMHRMLSKRRVLERFRFGHNIDSDRIWDWPVGPAGARVPPS